MANLLQNMLTLQNEHQIPMRMDLNLSGKIKYYESFKRFDSPKILDDVIKDLKQKDIEAYAAYIEAMKREDTPSAWYNR